MYRSFEGIILAKREYREADRLFTVVTLERGKRTFLAQGARKITTKTTRYLDPGYRVFLSIVRGRRLDRIIGVEIADTFQEVRRDVYLVGLAGFFLQLVDRFSAEDHPDERIYHLLQSGLHQVSRMQGRKGSQRLITQFVLQLLTFSGWQPDVSRFHLSSAGKRTYEEFISRPLEEFLLITSDPSDVEEIVRTLKAILKERFEHLHLSLDLPAQKFFYAIAKSGNR